MTRFRSNLYNMMISDSYSVSLMNVCRHEKTTDHAGRILLLGKMEMFFEKYVF